MPAQFAAQTSESSRNAVLQEVHSTVPPHFQQAQHSLANHRKNIVSLHRIHLSCSTISEQTPKGTRLVGEKAFNDAFMACLNRVLSLKRGVSNADRVIKFAAAYCTYTQEQFRAAARKAFKQQSRPNNEEEEDEEEDDEEEDTPATRFVAILLKHLLRGFSAKDKNVRLRCCQAVALLISGLESIDDDLYETLKAALLIRASDREPSVRVQAVIALSKLQGGEEEDVEAALDPENDERLDITAILIRVLRHDPSAEVRRAALFNLSLNEETLPYILERLCDVDTINRRCLYLGSLSNAVLEAPDCQVKLGREEWSSIVKTGLGERESSVVRAMKKLIASWINLDGGKTEAERFLSRFDVVSAPEPARMALEAAFEVRPALLDTIAFDDDFWQAISPEKAFVARIFAKHCKTLGAAGERRMEDTLPLVTALAFRTQAAWGKLVEQVEIAQASEEDEDDQAIKEKESIVQSLLHVSMTLDYGDEIGRRKMFGLVRDLVSNSLLPEELIGDCLDVLRKLSAGQKDFIRIIVEIAQEIEDVIEPQEEEQGSESEDEAQIEGQLLGQPARVVTMSSEERAQQVKIDARRLTIVQGMLERVTGNMQENTAMHGLVSQLIAPAVRSKNSAVRERGLTCLGLCCLLDPKLAHNTFGLFLQQMEEEDETVRLASIRVVFDNLTSHGIAYLCQSQIQEAGGDRMAVETVHAQMVNFLLGLLEDDNQEVQAVAAEGMAKLMLSGIVEDDDALRSLILVYMSPETSGNQQLRQCLSYFLPVYCYSSSACQRRLQRVTIATLDVLTEVYHERDEGQEMVTPLQVGMQLIDWSDPSKALYTTKDASIHIDVAIELLQSLYIKEEKEDRKVLCQLLAKLNLPDEDELQVASPDEADYLSLTVLFALLGTMKNVHSLDKWDALSRNTFNRFQLNCKKKYASSWDSVRSVDTFQSPELEGVRAFLQECGVDVEEVIDMGDDGTEILPAAGKSTSTTATTSAAASRRTTPTSRNVSANALRKVSGADSATSTGSSTPNKKSRMGVSSSKDNNSSGRGDLARAARKSLAPITIDSEEEDESMTASMMIKEEDDDDDADDFDTI